MKKKVYKKQRDIIRRILNDELHEILNDVSYRLGVLYDATVQNGRVGSRDLNLAFHMLDGYTVTDNTPAGGITWADVHIVYKGVDYAITGANTTMKYVWFDFSATPNTTLQCSDTKPVLLEEDTLVFINNGGVHVTAMTSGKYVSGNAIVNGTVGGNEIASSAIGSGHLANNAVILGKIASGAVGTAAFVAGAVDSAALGNGAVIAGKLGTGANAPVGSTNIVSGAVDSAALGSGAVTTTKIADGNITTAKIGSKQVATGNIADNAIGTGQLGSKAVTGGNIADGTITGTQIGAGQIATGKLNVAQHMIF